MTAQVSIHVGSLTTHLPAGLTRGNTIREHANLADGETLFLDLTDEIDIPVANSDWIVIRGGERFAVGCGTSSIEDNPCLRVPLQVQVNGHPLSEDRALHRPKLTGSELRRLDPEAGPAFRVVADLEGLPDEFLPDDQRLIVQPNDRFITVPCGNVGDVDIVGQHLRAVQKMHSTAYMSIGGGHRYLLIPDFELPPGWSKSETAVMFIIPNGYPFTPLDMFYVDSDVTLANGKEAKGAGQIEVHMDRSWRRFSWHYSDAATAWSPTRSDFRTHLAFANLRLSQRM